MADDVVALQQVVFDVARCSDMARVDLMMASFAEHAVLDLGARQVRGRDAIAEYFSGGKPPDGDRERTKHVISNVLVEVDAGGERASSTSYFQVLRSFGLAVWGRYHDRFERTDGRWLIVERRVVSDGQAPPRPS